MRTGMLRGVMGILLVAGCDITPYGSAADYWPGSEEIDIVMPAGALHIAQQYRPPGVEGPGVHYGIDIWGPAGSPILAAARGRVVRSFYEPLFGHQIIVDHGPDGAGERAFTWYKHLKTRDVLEGDQVARGAQIGTMGATGFQGLAVHLHFEVLHGPTRQKADPVDPNLMWLDGVGRITCYDPSRHQPDQPFATTYPTPCKGV